MGVKKAYKVGSISGALSKDASSVYDPKLCDIFTSSAFKPKSTPATAVPNDSKVNSKAFTEKLKGKHEKLFAGFKVTEDRINIKKERISNNDAASFRVKAKRKFTSESDEAINCKVETAVAPSPSFPEEPSKKKKKKSTKKPSIFEQDETSQLNLIEDDVPAPKLKKKKLGKSKASELQLQQASEAQEISSALPKKVKKEKKVSKKSNPENADSTVVDERKSPGTKKKLKKDKKAKLSKLPQSNEEIINEFEKEQDMSELDEDSSDDDEAKPNADEKDSEASKKLKHFELNKPKEKDPEQEGRTVFVGNLPPYVIKKKLKKLFDPFGTIETIRYRCAAPQKPYLLKKVAVNSKKLNPNQYNLAAYIRFKTIEEAEKAAAELNGHEIDQHAIVVDLAENKTRDNKKAIFMGNLPLKIQDDTVRKFFSECGKIASIRIVRNPQTGLGRGIGYINFLTVDSVELALKKDGETLDGRPIRVNKAVKKEKKSKEQLIKEKAEKFGNAGKKIQAQGKNATRRLDKKNKNNNSTDEVKFTGDRLSEIGVLKRKSSKPDKGELKKARIASKLTGVSSTQFKKFNREKTEKKETQKNFNRDKTGKKDMKKKFTNKKTIEKVAAKKRKQK